MGSRSSRVSNNRPFYDQHAEAYDALITDPIGPWVDAVDRRTEATGVSPARLLDAGCGTGRHAEALAQRGHHVALLDASARLLEIARGRCPEATAWQTDICAPTVDNTFDALTCRGVLNDLVLDEERDAVFDAFASLIDAGGLLFLDVRERVASAARADGEIRRNQASLPDGTTLVFASRPRWIDECIVVDETYEMTHPDRGSTLHEYTFAMRPWAQEDLTNRLHAAGFVNIDIRPGIGRRTDDRLFVVAQRR